MWYPLWYLFQWRIFVNHYVKKENILIMLYRYSPCTERGRDFFDKFKCVSVANHYDFRGSGRLHGTMQRKEELFEDYWSLRRKINAWVEIKILLTLMWKILYSHGISGFPLLHVETVHALLAHEFVRLVECILFTVQFFTVCATSGWILLWAFWCFRYKWLEPHTEHK
jgi:hypothetical protein